MHMAAFSQAPISRSDFEIGILCSTDLEYTAICLLLDDCWDAEGYTFGRVEGDFNFYVALDLSMFYIMLSDRGKASAAAAATSLRSSYHDLKLIFITGICDGVPGTKGEDGELALGDVVVSKSIVQYDLGRLYSDKLAIKTAVEDSLGRPSRDVRNFIAAMSTRPHRKALEKRAAAHLAQIQKEAVNRVIYEYPGSANDILFEPTYYHECHHLPKCACMDDPSQELSCEETGCDYNRQLHRQRFEDTKLPQVNQGWFVFFGRIGSGDTISMSGIYRDQIARELDIIALETGSAGAWDELPCVIVKGVSGYGDGHKNNTKNRRAISLELNANSVSKAIEDYINHQVQALSALKEYTGASRSDPLPKPSEFPAELGSLYGRMITKVCDFRTSGQGRKILAIATVSRRPLTIKEFNSLVDTSEDHRQSLELVWSDILGYCGSFLTLRDEASAQLFPDGFGLVHTNIFKHCISAMHKTLRRNMYDLKNPGCLANQVTLDPVKSSTLTSVAYFYVYWIHHFEQSVTGPGLDTSDNTERHKVLYTFLSEKYIYWLEALSLLKSVFTGMEDLRRLKSLVIDEQLSGLKDLVQDNYRFIQMFGKVIADFPLQVYISGLLFSPPQSLTHRLFTKESPKCIQLLPPKKVNWDQYLQRFDGHTDTITSLDTSCCGTWLASSSLDETIKIWEAKTGRLIRSMKTYSFSCISFSPWNSNEIACGGLHRDEIIIWDIVTGKMLQQINAETNYIKLLSLLSSVQNDAFHTQRMANQWTSRFTTQRTGEMTNQAKFPLTPEKVRYLVAFSTKDSRIFAVAQKWSKIFNTHDVKLYSLNANNELQKLHCLTCPKTSAMRFSQSGHLIVVHTMSIKSTCISMFDVATGAALWRSQIVLYVSLPYLALSRDGRLALCDISKVAILDVATGKMLSTQRIELGELVFPYEQDGKHIYVASENVINVVELGSQEPSRKNPSSGHIEQLATSYQRAVLSPDERQLATFTWQPMPMIVVCDTSFQKKTCIRKHSLGASCVLKFSPDSSKLACLLRRNLRVWDVSSGSKTKTLLYHKHYCESYDYTIRFSEDGIYLAVAYTSRESLGGQKVKIQIWNVDTSQRFIYLETLKEKDESPRESFLAFSPSSKFLAISWHINKRDVKRDVTRVEVWDVTSRKGVFSKSICGGDLKSSTRIPSPLTSPSGSSQSNSWINFRGEKLLWLPPEYRPFQDSWDIQQNCILIREPYEARLFLLKFCCSGCIGRVFTPGWQPDESTLCSADAEAPVARPELSDSELEFLTMDPPDDKMMVFSSKSIADIWRIVNREIVMKIWEQVFALKMSAANPPKFIYKILPAAPQDPLPEQFPFSQLDANDGFVHLSTATQVPNTADLFFTEATELWLIKLELAKLADPLKWEDGFPHLYGNFGAADVQSLEKFERKEGQKWSEGMKASYWLE
ncbi:LOW QUALITY PROTEIN: hypothetical protein N5P37_008487 [Trichoderma harzianum]|nr:LOW QUALITY PROTEIN: hypothetical protein N5P37_008487 [Trichoderma harzianum]